MVNWKFYLDKKKMSLQGFVDDHKIENMESAKNIFTRIGVTSPNQVDFESCGIKWFAHEAPVEEVVVEVANISKRRQGGRSKHQ